MWDHEVTRELVDCPPSSLRWAALGYRVGLQDGCATVLATIADAGRNAASMAKPILAQPHWDELVERRKVAHKYCPRRCLKCSSCIGAEAWQRRGGRPYLGVAQEREMAETAHRREQSTRGAA